MSQDILNYVEKTSLKEKVPSFEIGDTVDVHTKILEGEKERIQKFTGTGTYLTQWGSYGSGNGEFEVPIDRFRPLP